MSRIGNSPVKVPPGVRVSIETDRVLIEGPQGKLEYAVPEGISVTQEGDTLRVTRTGNERRVRSFHGLVRALLQGGVIGAAEGYVKQLDIVGVSYQARLEGQNLMLQVGFANPVKKTIPAGLTVEVPSSTVVVVRGADKQKVGQFAAEVRAVRPPEPYKGKGIRYQGERVTRKQGKSFVSSE
ncbi:MAG: 50S ribosomal protein L6 [Planctomycetota bacterium]|nr:50S ribosomal protein L6 [Planctomycetota bacterium]